jgi:hypothetical protein
MVRYLFTLFLILTAIPLKSIGQPKVLAELFRNDNCSNCMTADTNYDNYVASHPGVVLINYSNSNADANDPFFVASKPASDDRDKFYAPNVGLSDPNAYIDGFAGGANAEPTWESITTLSLSNTLPVIAPKIGFNLDGSGIDTISFSVSGSVDKNVIAYVAIKESKLYYDNPYGYGKPPGNIWNDVFRTMIPARGSSSFLMTGTHNFTVLYDPVDSNYFFSGVPQNMTAIIFVQDVNVVPSSNNSRQIEAIGEISMDPATAGVAQPASSSNRLILPVNPILHQGHLCVQLSQAAQVRIVLSDMLGRDVHTIGEVMMPEGQTSIEMASGILPAGCYIARMIVDGNEVDHAKLIVE